MPKKKIKHSARPWLDKGIKAKQLVINLPKNFKFEADGEAIYTLIKNSRYKCPICGLPWPERFELDKRIQTRGITLPNEMVDRLLCFNSANNFIKTLIETEKGLCPACRQ